MLVAERRDLLVARLRREGKLVARDLAAEFAVRGSMQQFAMRAYTIWQRKEI